jgi:hypothetical protein
MPRKMANMANEASTDVDSPQSLKLFIVAIFNRYLGLFQTGPFFAIFGNFFSTIFAVLTLFDCQYEKSDMKFGIFIEFAPIYMCHMLPFAL